MGSNIRNCEIHVSIEEDGKDLFTGSLGEGLHWTPLECVLIVRAMSSIMIGTTDSLVVDMGIARLVGVAKRVGAAADQAGLSRRTFAKLMNEDVNYRKKRGPKGGKHND